MIDNREALIEAARLLSSHRRDGKSLRAITKKAGLEKKYAAIDTILTLVAQPDRDEKAERKLDSYLNKTDLSAFLIEYYRDKNTDPEGNIYQAIKNSGDFGNSSRIKEYLGSYSCYRKSAVDSGLIVGSISIRCNETLQSYFFDHKTSLKLKYEGQSEIRDYSHTGPVFAASKRIYLLGVGHDRDGNYIRPMILSDVDQVEKTPLVGLLLTETNEHEPYACKIVLLHDDLMQSDDPKFGRSANREAEIYKLLSYDSISTGVLFGWSSNAAKLGVTV